MYSVHMDPKVWGDPENFRPERFLDKDNNVIRKKDIMPFFLGRFYSRVASPPVYFVLLWVSLQSLAPLVYYRQLGILSMCYSGRKSSNLLLRPILQTNRRIVF